MGIYDERIKLGIRAIVHHHGTLDVFRDVNLSTLNMATDYHCVVAQTGCARYAHARDALMNSQPTTPGRVVSSCEWSHNHGFSLFGVTWFDPEWKRLDAAWREIIEDIQRALGQPSWLASALAVSDPSSPTFIP